MKRIRTPYLLFFSLVLISLTGCATFNKTAPERFICGETLDKQYFEPCSVPQLPTSGVTFEQIVNGLVEHDIALKACRVKTDVLQKTLQTCLKHGKLAVTPE